MQQPIILFDGVCNFCVNSVQFIIKRDSQGLFHFAPLQSILGKQLLKKSGLSPTALDTIVLVDGHTYYTRSTAALYIVKKLSGLWPLLFGLIIVPTFIRNLVYTFVAKHRYEWFGKKEECFTPTPEIKTRFLE